MPPDHHGIGRAIVVNREPALGQCLHHTGPRAREYRRTSIKVLAREMRCCERACNDHFGGRRDSEASEFLHVLRRSCTGIIRDEHNDCTVVLELRDRLDTARNHFASAPDHPIEVAADYQAHTVTIRVRP